MKKPDEAVAAAAAWWAETRPDPAARQPGDRAAFARLRRCATVAEAMQEVSAIILFRRLGGTSRGEDIVRAGLLAGVLAFVREDVPGAKAARLVGPESPERPETATLKPLRFRRLLEATEPDDKLLAFRRLVQLADARLPVLDLAYALLFPGERRQRDWLLAYWNALSPAAPADKEPAP